MAYNFNANQPYGNVNYAFQAQKRPYAPAFGHQAYTSPYPAMPAQPFPALGNLVPLAPLPPLPMPGQTFTTRSAPIAPAPNFPPLGAVPRFNTNPFTPNSGGGSSWPAPTPKPQVQNYYYTMPNTKEPPSKKKNIKKFLLTTGSVVTGVFAAAGLAVGALFLFAPSQARCIKELGAKPFDVARKINKIVKDSKKPLSAKFTEIGEYLYKGLNDPLEQKEKSWFQKGMGKIQKFINPDAFEKAKKAAELAAKKPAEGQGIEKLTGALLETLEKLPQAQKDKANNYLIDILSQAMAKSFGTPEAIKYGDIMMNNAKASIPVVGRWYKKVPVEAAAAEIGKIAQNKAG